MDMPRLGHAVIVNNVATEFPGSMADVEALHNVYHQMGLEVRVHKDCDQNVSDVTLPQNIKLKMIEFRPPGGGASLPPPWIRQ